MNDEGLDFAFLESVMKLAGGELGFQRVHQGHQFVHFRHDPALFGEGCKHAA